MLAQATSPRAVGLESTSVPTLECRLCGEHSNEARDRFGPGWWTMLLFSPKQRALNIFYEPKR